MADSAGLLRQWNLLTGLSARPQGTTVEELMVQIRTIRRDLKALKQAGFPLEQTKGDFGRGVWRLSAESALVPMSFTWDEAISLCLARRFLEPLAGTMFWAAASKAFGKIRAVLGQQPLSYLDKMASALHVTTRGTSDKYAAKAEVCDLLTQAIENREMVDLAYQSDNATESASRTVYPLGFVFHSGSLYLVAHSPDHEEHRIYKLDRVESAHLLKLKFQRPLDFSLKTFLNRWRWMRKVKS